MSHIYPINLLCFDFRFQVFFRNPLKRGKSCPPANQSFFPFIGERELIPPENRFIRKNIIAERNSRTMNTRYILRLLHAIEGTNYDRRRSSTMPKQR